MKYYIKYLDSRAYKTIKAHKAETYYTIVTNAYNL